MEEFDAGVTIAKPATLQADDPLLAIGNSAGAGVLTVLDGNVVSLGPDVVEVTNGVIQGNSGGPVFSGKTGEVVAVVTHLLAAREDIWSKNTGFGEVRRFATRLDREIKWQQMPIGKFVTEAGIIEEFNRNTRILLAISMLNPMREGLRLDVRVANNGPTLLSFFDENKNVPAVAELIEMNSKLGDKRMRISEVDLRKRFASYYGTTMGKINSDGDKFLPANFSSYNRKLAEQSRLWRDEAIKRVKSAIDSLR